MNYILCVPLDSHFQIFFVASINQTLSVELGQKLLFKFNCARHVIVKYDKELKQVPTQHYLSFLEQGM